MFSELETAERPFAMGTAVRFMPLCGVYSEDPLCYLLQVSEDLDQALVVKQK